MRKVILPRAPSLCCSRLQANLQIVFRDGEGFALQGPGRGSETTEDTEDTEELHDFLDAPSRLCRTTSYSTTPAATDTFSDGTFPEHRNRHQKIAVFAHQIVQSLAFGAEHDGAMHLVVNRVISLLAALVQSDDPQILLFQFLERARYVRDFRDGKVFARSRRNLRHRACDRGGTAFGNHHAIGSGGVGGAQDRSQIVRIFDSIEHDDQRLLAATRRHQVIEIAILFCRSRGHQSLMRGVAGNFVEFHARQNAHRNADLAALVNHPLQANIFSLLGDADPLEVAPARLERFRNRIDSVENVHAE